MHYKNGRPANNGDRIVFIDKHSKKVIAGILFGATAEGGNQCNGNIAPCDFNHYADLSNCLHAEDAVALLLNEAVVPDASKA